MPAKKGSTTARGYGSRHQAERKIWQQRINGGMVYCARCRKPIHPGMLWDLDHAAGKRGYLGPSHRTCNRSAGGKAGGKLGAAITNAKKRARRRVSRRW